MGLEVLATSRTAENDAMPMRMPTPNPRGKLLRMNASPIGSTTAQDTGHAVRDPKEPQNGSHDCEPDVSRRRRGERVVSTHEGRHLAARSPRWSVASKASAGTVFRS